MPDKLMSEYAELFEKIAHPTRVKILELLEQSPLEFGQLKSELGVGSSGNLDHHLKKLEGLVFLLAG
jgi:DNA-binding transcriptional ArsR family regulator